MDAPLFINFSRSSADGKGGKKQKKEIKETRPKVAKDLTTLIEEKSATPSELSAT